MLHHALVAEVQRLLAEGKLSQRSIARLTGVSRGTVGSIASGQRPDYESLHHKDPDEEESLGPPRRCPSCGGMVYGRCRLCHVRESRAANPALHPFHASHEEHPRLQLRPEHQIRYEQVRAWRREAAARMPAPC
jgi:hypothetical protein